MHKLILACVQIELPSRVVALGIGVEPARKRQPKLGESAIGAHAMLRSDRNMSRRTGPSAWIDIATQQRKAGERARDVINARAQEEGCRSSFIRVHQRDWEEMGRVGVVGCELAAQ